MAEHISAIDSARNYLKSKGYYTENLWTIYDVPFEVTEEQAQQVLHRALTNDATMEQIKLAINMLAEDLGLTRKEEE